MHRVKVLVVDDSAYIRQTVSRILNSDPGISVVGKARNGEEALAATEMYKPDVVVTDLDMPQMNGVEFIRRQMKKEPIPIVVLSVASETGHLAGEASASGAVEFISKPTGLSTNEIHTVRKELIAKVLMAAAIPHDKIFRNLTYSRLADSLLDTPVRLICIGLSTGGPRALEYMLQSLPPDLPVPLVAVVHMPVGYTGFFAERLNQLSRFEVLEAENGLALKPGRLVLGKAGREIKVCDFQGSLTVTTPPAPTIANGISPSVDQLFRSAADAVGQNAIGVVCTGMGRDGTEGAAWLAAQGATIVAESEESCVVYGMPRSVVERGLADYVEPLSDIPRRLVDLCIG